MRFGDCITKKYQEVLRMKNEIEHYISLRKQQLKLSNFCSKYDIQKTTILELIYNKKFLVFKIGNR